MLLSDLSPRTPSPLLLPCCSFVRVTPWLLVAQAGMRRKRRVRIRKAMEMLMLPKEAASHDIPSGTNNCTVIQCWPLDAEPGAGPSGYDTLCSSES
ncbi:hypothetical protein V8C26DRAFT_409114 [Trichoderma gracile]